MAEKEKLQQKEVAASFMTIEKLAKEKQISCAIFEGTKAYQGWKNGKMVTEDEFLQAIEAFKKAEIRK